MSMTGTVGRLLARDVMSTPVLTVRPDTTIPDVAAVLADRDVGGVPVVDDAGQVVGIVTEADLLLKAAGAPAGVRRLAMFLAPPRRNLKDQLRRSEGRTAGEIMSRKVITADEGTSVRELAGIMARHEVARIPITRDGKLTGIVTRHDVMALFGRDDAELATAVRAAVGQRTDPSALEVAVSHGIVSVSGKVQRHSDARLIEVSALSVDGVIDADVSGVVYEIDDMSW